MIPLIVVWDHVHLNAIPLTQQVIVIPISSGIHPGVHTRLVVSQQLLRLLKGPVVGEPTSWEFA